MTLGIVANEFFEPTKGRMGGFGFAARSVARLFGDDRALGVEVVLIQGDRRTFRPARVERVHGARFLVPARGRRAMARQLAAEDVDLLLAIDYRPSYRAIFDALPATPLVVWVRDPRTPEDVSRVATVRVPWRRAARPEGLDPIDCSSLVEVVRASRSAGRAVVFATPAPHLESKLKATYGIQPEELLTLPNIIEVPGRPAAKSATPSVVFLGRSDPIKRPWIAVEVARVMPEVDFWFLGREHFGSALPPILPANVRICGHVDGADKLARLGSAWALINTSVHEALAVSFLEALACETPLISCCDPGGIVAQFGIAVGPSDGDGLAAVPALSSALRTLLADEERRCRLGRAGRVWVSQTHSRAAFLRAFEAVNARAGHTYRAER